MAFGDEFFTEEIERQSRYNVAQIEILYPLDAIAIDKPKKINISILSGCSRIWRYVTIRHFTCKIEISLHRFFVIFIWRGLSFRETQNVDIAN